MAKPARSPLLGYNHNVKYKGRIFHVQTEDSGPSNPHLNTHLYFEGTILGSKRHGYDCDLPEEDVRALMQSQHKEILKDLKQAVYDERLSLCCEHQGLPLAAAPGELTVAEAEVETGGAAAMPGPRGIDIAGVPPPAAEYSVVLDLDAISAPATTLVEAQAALDLDELAPRTGKTPAPEAMPIEEAHQLGGPGRYLMTKTGREEVVPPLKTPGSVPRARTPSAPPQPAADGRDTPMRPIPAVVVQRQVVVGGEPAGSPPPFAARPAPAQRPRRSSGMPYIVKEGSHPVVLQPPRPAASHPVVSSRPLSPTVPPPPPPRPMVPLPATSAHAPRTTATIATVPPPRPERDTLIDKSLDDLILAYLSQGEGQKLK